MTTVNISKRGEIVIPKKIREQLRLEKAKTVHLAIKNNTLEILPHAPFDVVQSAKKRAERLHLDTEKIVMGSNLYDKIFEEKWTHVPGR